MRGCSDCGTTTGEHADGCYWKNCSQDTFGNASKIARDQRLMEADEDAKRMTREGL